MIELSVIVVVYNCAKELRKLLTDFLKGNQQIDIEVIIVDNASSDKTDELVKSHFKKVIFLKNKRNLGFATAANQGAEIAKGRWFLFLNPDTVVSPHNIEQMLRFIKSNSKIGIAGCKILNSDGSLQPSCGNFPTILNIFLDRIPLVHKIFKTELIRDDSYYELDREPDWVSGAFFLVKRDIFRKLNGFDENYFMYAEDVDFCYRARRSGYRIFYCSKVEIIHFDQGKKRDNGRFKAKHMRRGFTTFFEKYKPQWYADIWKLILTFEKLLKPSLR